MSSSPAAAPPVIDEVLCQRALTLARDAVAHGNHPFGALMVDAQGQILLECENTVVTSSDSSAHAEMNVVRGLSQVGLTYGSEALQGATLYTSTEPCMMCCGAMYWAGVSRVVFVASEQALAAHAGDDFLTPAREIFAKGKRPVLVQGPVLEEEGGKIHEAFWPGFFASLGNK
jgi:tRNA(Arg) A34 adenosine deaminase TadA